MEIENKFSTDCLPRFLIAENVKGILYAIKGKAFPMIMKEFRDAGYTVTHKLLNASEYGVPQKRVRVIIMGFRDLEDFQKFHYPMKVRLADRKVLGDVIIKANDLDQTLFFSDKAVAGMMAVLDKMNKGRAMSLSVPCNTISAHLAKVSLNSTDPVYIVGDKYRCFSSREAARIQSFPDSFRFDSVSQIRQYKAIGNAVPPVMMWHVIHSLQKTLKITQVDFTEIREQYPTSIVENVNETSMDIDRTKNVLISLVKADNIDQYLDRSAKVYYTGKRFPSTVALNKLYYFMPYVKRKGIRDLYFIKIARVGTRKEGQPDEDKNDFRLVFEIDFVGQLFDEYKPIKLEIWRTFTDTIIDKLIP